MGISTAAHSTVDAPRPDSHQLVGILWHLAHQADNTGISMP
jgi:hypothetical protein